MRTILAIACVTVFASCSSQRITAGDNSQSNTNTTIVPATANTGMVNKSNVVTTPAQNAGSAEFKSAPSDQRALPVK